MVHDCIGSWNWKISISSCCGMDVDDFLMEFQVILYGSLIILDDLRRYAKGTCFSCVSFLPHLSITTKSVQDRKPLFHLTPVAFPSVGG